MVEGPWSTWPHSWSRAAAMAAPACPANPIAGTVPDVTQAAGDFDGDGKRGVLRAYRLGAAWHLQVDLAAGVAADATVTPPGPTNIAANNGHRQPQREEGWR